MAILTHCPGCNAPIQVEEDTTSVVCQFCGTQFEVNLIDVSPNLRKAGTPEDSATDQPDENLPASESALPEPASYTYNPPIPGETHPTTDFDLYNPPIPGASGTSDQPVDSPPPFYTPPAAPQNRLSGARLWILLGIVILGAFCITCLCLTLFVFNIIG